MHEVNQVATVYRNKRRNRRVPAVVDVDVDNQNNNQLATSSDPPRPHLLKLDDLTSVLKHISMAEDAKPPMRWDMIGEMTSVVYGENRTHPKPKHVNVTDNDNNNNYDMEHSVDGDEFSTWCWTTSVESTSRAILTMMLEQTDGKTVCSDCDTADEHGYPLNPSAHTCASSVTWWEGSNYEEVEVMTDDEDIRIMCSSCFR